MERIYFSANRRSRLIFCSLRPLLGRLSVRPGTLDTEIAVSVHQPQHLVEDYGLPHGDVALFRLRLLEEHLGCQSGALTDPGSADCNQFVRGVCQINWEVGGG